MIKIFDSIEKINIFAAEKTVEIAGASIRSKGRFTIALAGGSTPKMLYQMLSSDEYKNKIDWSNVFFFLGDERMFSPASEESNYWMACENLFAPLKITDENVFRWRTELQNGEKIAADYEKTIKIFFDLNENEFPRFDLILLGMGDDGHTASLFPFTDALNETAKFAVANPVKKLETTRLTFTFPVINNAANVIFLVKGCDKAETLSKVLSSEFQPDKFPSQSVKPANGNLFWLVDEAAAQFLK